jgi:drug/metabolite transporter (DMT)-like permease
VTPDIVYALGALVCYGLGDIIYKRAAIAGLAAEQLLLGQAWFFCPAVLGYGWVTGTLEFNRAAVWGGLAGVFLLVGFYNFARSLKSGAVSVVAPVFRLNFIVTAALAIGWLHEPVTAPKLAGIALSLLAGWLLLAAPAAGDPAPARQVPVLRIVVATVAVGVANFCHKLGLVGGATPETLLAAQAIVFSILITAMVYRIAGSIRPAAGLAQHSGPAALVLTLAFLFLLHSLKRGDASVMVPIAQMGFTVAALLGVVAFAEALTLRKLAGLAAAVAALLVLAIS